MTLQHWALSSLLFFFGCGAGTTSNVPPTTAGSSILFPGVTAVIFQSFGGGYKSVPEPIPAGAACDPAASSYTIGFDGPTVQFDSCTVSGDSSDPASYIPLSEPITVTSDQWTMIDAAVAAVTVSAKRSCGEDGPLRALIVETATASYGYQDDFYSCPPTQPPFVTAYSLDNLQQVLQAVR
ncbi:MAG TPA: hypothetical protein VHO06_08455 [Polyangia bacterium]|nr:hypothetical protein [Polyangia bacterium]